MSEPKDCPVVKELTGYSLEHSGLREICDTCPNRRADAELQEALERCISVIEDAQAMFGEGEEDVGAIEQARAALAKGCGA